MAGRKRKGIFQKNGWWWIDYRDTEGRRHREKAAPTADGAWKVYCGRVAQVQRGERLGVKDEGITFAEFMNTKYWPRIAFTWSAGEKARAASLIERTLIPYFGARRLSILKREDIEEWIAHRQGERVRGHQIMAGTVNKELMRLRHALRRAVVWGYLRADPTMSVRGMKEAPGRVRYLTAEEEAQLMAEAPQAVRDYILWAIHTGARREELTRLTWGDLNFTSRLIRFPVTKNNEPRYVPMTGTVQRWLRSQVRPTDPAAKVLPPLTPNALTVAFSRLVRKLGLHDLRFHDLRHHTASILTMRGVPQRTIMAILGHKDPRMTIRYQHLAPEYLQEAMATLDEPAKGHQAGTATP